MSSSNDDPSDFFALPPFKADEALVKLRRDLRELKALAEKGTGASLRFEWRAMPAVELSVANNAEGKPVIDAAVAKQPSQRPQWTRQQLASSADARKWLDEVKRSLKRWDDED